MEVCIARKVSSLLAKVAALTFAGVFSGSGQTLAEALDTTNLVWTTGGDVAWFAQTTNTYDGVDAVQCGSIHSNQTSWIETTVPGPATISFWSVTRRNRWDAPAFGWQLTVNGLHSDASATTSSTWSEQIHDLGEGLNVLRWTASNPHGGTGGFVCLDGFAVSSPRALAITYQPVDRTVYPGEWASFFVQVIGTPPFQYQWRKNGTNLSNATNDWIYFDPATNNDGGIYSVMISNSQGFIVSSNAALTLLPPTAPFFTQEPWSATAYTGQNLGFWAAVSGSPPIAYQWRKDGTNLPDANLPLLSLTNLSPAHAGNYTLYVTNGYGAAESSNAVLTVIQSVAPAITRHPRSLEVAEGVNTWLSVNATGVPDPCYVWTKVGSPPAPPPPGPPPLVVCQSSGRSFNSVSSNDAGIYFVSANNPAGVAVSRDALLTVLPPLSLKASWGQAAEDIVVTNGFAFLACGTNGLTILNLSNPASPQFLGSYDTAGYASAVQVAGHLVFVADGSAGLQVISITNPSNPMLIGGYDTPGSARDVVVRSNLAFVADGNLLILDVSSPAAPSVVGSYSTNLSSHRICLAGNFAYLTSLAPVIGPGSNYWVGGMLIVDVSNPAQPTEAGRWGTSVQAATARDRIVFTDVSVISVANPAQPNVVGAFAYHSTNFPPIFRIPTTDLQVVNDLAYLAGSSGGQMQLFIFDVRDSTEPIPVGYFAAPGQADALWVDGRFVYLVGYDSPLLIIETPFDPQPVNLPALSLAQQGGMKLQVQGRRGSHYDLEYAEGLHEFAWQSLQMILLTNESTVIEVPSNSSMRFFRLKQLD